MRRFAKFSGIVGILALSAIYLAEFFVGRYAIAHSGHFPVDMFVENKPRGIALSPGFQRVVKRVQPFRVSVNSQGYRDRDWNRTKPRRVLLVGSSATFGFGLDREDGIAAQLEKEFGPDISVLNGAVYSYGPPQALATINLECRKWRPRLIVYLHEYKMTRPDFLANRDVKNSVAGNSTGASGNAFGWHLPALRMYLSNHGVHPRQILERLWGLDRLGDDYIRARYVITGSWGTSCRDCTSRAAKIIARMLQSARRCGADFIMAVLPGPGAAYYGFREPATVELLDKLADIDPDLPLADMGRGIPVGSILTIPGLDYFSADGSRSIATKLAQRIRNTLPHFAANSAKIGSQAK